MHIPKLNEFSNNELTELLAAVQDKLEDCAKNLKSLSSFDDNEWKADQTTFWRNKADVYLLWKTQIMNALVDVKKKELSTLN